MRLVFCVPSSAFIVRDAAAPVPFPPFCTDICGTLSSVILLVPYTAFVGGWFLISQTIERVSKHKIAIGLHYRDAYLWIALGIMVVNFILKNVLLLVWHVDILANYVL